MMEGIDSIKRIVERRAKKYKKQYIIWADFFDTNLDGYLQIGEKKLLVYEVLERMADLQAPERKVLLYVAMLGEVINEAEEKQLAGLDSYKESELYTLLRKIATRMRNHDRSPFSECAGLTPEQARDALISIRNAFVKHPLSIPKAYNSVVQGAQSWQGLLVKTYYFAQVRSELERAISKTTIMRKAVEKGQAIGVVRI